MCSECLKTIPAHSYGFPRLLGGMGAWSSGSVRMACRETFDDRFWQGRADDREWGLERATLQVTTP